MGPPKSGAIRDRGVYSSVKIGVKASSSLPSQRTNCVINQTSFCRSPPGPAARPPPWAYGSLAAAAHAAAVSAPSLLFKNLVGFVGSLHVAGRCTTAPGHAPGPGIHHWSFVSEPNRTGPSVSGHSSLVIRLAPRGWGCCTSAGRTGTSASAACTEGEG